MGGEIVLSTSTVLGQVDWPFEFRTKSENGKLKGRGNVKGSADGKSNAKGPATRRREFVWGKTDGRKKYYEVEGRDSRFKIAKEAKKAWEGSPPKSD